MSESSLSNFREIKNPLHRDLILSSFVIYLFPLLLLIPKEGAPGVFYFSATTAEFLLSNLFVLLYKFRILSYRNYRYLEYYLLFTTSLPMTVYLFVFPFSSLPVFIRFLFAYVILARLDFRRAGKVLLFLFSTGIFVFSYILEAPFPVRRQIFLAASAWLTVMVLESYESSFRIRMKEMLRRKKQSDRNN